MNRQHVLFGVVIALIAAIRVANGATFDLNLTADGDSRWYDYFSDAFGQVDQGFRDDEARDGFFLISELPNYVPIGRGADLFPTENDFSNFGTIDYDAATGEISDISIDVDGFVAFNFSVLNSRLGDGYSTTVSNPTGTVSLQGDNVSAINLTADVTLTYGQAPPNVVPYNGTFTIENDRFILDVDEAVNVPGFGTFRYAWDIHGDVEGLVSSSIPGDFNGDTQLTAEDIDLLSDAVQTGGNDPQFDLDESGVVDEADRTTWVVDSKNTFFGDANLDGEFNSSDFTAVFTAAEYEDNIALNSGWASGDWNGDKEFDSGDFVTAFTGAGYESGPRILAVVPEPSGLAPIIGASAALALLWRRQGH